MLSESLIDEFKLQEMLMILNLKEYQAEIFSYS